MEKLCEHHEIVVIGGGPAGLAAAIAAKENGCSDVLLIERDRLLGGILNQCIHDGFGLHVFNEALSGPEYADRFEKRMAGHGVNVLTNTIVLSLSKEKIVRLSREGEIKEISADAVILAMGCRERARGAISIPGDRPSGVYTAGSVQNLVNLENIMPGNRVCILGSGDIGLIMARRMTLEGAKVEAVFEVLPYSSGLQRNIRQCLEDYNIPLYLSTTVIEIHGPKGRLEGVTVAEVDCNRMPIEGTKRFVPCDTLLLSVGLIPENELSREAGVVIDITTQGAIVDDNCMTSVPGIFACGNVLHVHDLVDFVSKEAARAGRAASRYVKEKGIRQERLKIKPGPGVRYVVPQIIASCRGEIPLAFRVFEPCTEKTIQVLLNDEVVLEENHKTLHPAEMVWLNINTLNNTKTGEIEVRLA